MLIFVVNCMCFKNSTEATRGLALPSLYIYQTTVGGDVRFMAFLTAVFSVGRVISSTLFGVLSDHYGFT